MKSRFLQRWCVLTWVSPAWFWRVCGWLLLMKWCDLGNAEQEGFLVDYGLEHEFSFTETRKSLRTWASAWFSETVLQGDALGNLRRSSWCLQSQKNSIKFLWIIEICVLLACWDVEDIWFQISCVLKQGEKTKWAPWLSSAVWGKLKGKFFESCHRVRVAKGQCAWVSN